MNGGDFAYTLVGCRTVCGLWNMCVGTTCLLSFLLQVALDSRILLTVVWKYSAIRLCGACLCGWVTVAAEGLQLGERVCLHSTVNMWQSVMACQVSSLVMAAVAGAAWFQPRSRWTADLGSVTEMKQQMHPTILKYMQAEK
jgi:hypothetical protein